MNQTRKEIPKMLHTIVISKDTGEMIKHNLTTPNFLRRYRQVEGVNVQIASFKNIEIEIYNDREERDEVMDRLN